METLTIPRLLRAPERSFFLFGPRGTGKSTWLQAQLPQALRLDLLDLSLALELEQNPHRLEHLIGQRAAGSWVIVDEIQRIPALLDEVHRLMEARHWRFALCGSSARKLRRTGVNLLAGRAITRHMAPFVSAELGPAFDLDFSLAYGMLPIVQTDRPLATDTLSAYVNTYLREEIRQEGVVRQTPPFMRFLGVAGAINGQRVNAQNIAREAAVPRSTVDTYFAILEDTLVGGFLPAWQPGFKVRESSHPKFFWFDPGVARTAAGLLRDPLDRSWLGTALETLVLHELRVHNEVSQKCRPLTFYRTAAGVEIDFVVETRKRQSETPAHVVCIEVKLAPKWERKWETPMRDLARHPSVCVQRMIGVYTGERAMHREGVDILPVAQFLAELHAGKVF